MMKKVLVSTVLTASAIAAHAQSSVTLYGTIDEGFQYLTHSSSSGKSFIGIQSGNAIPSLFGIKGSEDLGGGMSAYFHLENGYVVNTGEQASSTSFFNRASYIGFKDNEYGALELGKQWNLMFQELLDFDATSMGQYSLLSTTLFPASTDWPNNSIKYISPSYRGLTGYAEYSFGDQVAGNFRAGRYMAFALAYDHGPLSLRSIYEDDRGEYDASTGIDAAGEVQRRATLAAKYTFDKLTVMGGYANVSGNLDISPPGNLYWLGATYQANHDVRLLAQVMHADLFHEEGEPTWMVLGATYNFSPRTFVYTFLGYLDNKNAQTVSLNALDSSQPFGMSQTGVQIGINHSF